MELTHTSASQVKDFEACPRLWFFKSVKKRRPPQTGAQARGTYVHGGLERYLKGEDVTADKSALVTPEKLREYIEVLKPIVDRASAGVDVGKSLVEHKDEMPTYDGGPTFVLIVDHARETTVAGKTIPQIDDLKTTSDFRYCKTPDQLAQDVQMISYAQWVLRQYELYSEPMPDFVSVRHVYVRTRGKTVATERQRLMTPDEVRAQWTRVCAMVEAMVQIARTVEDPMDVAPNTAACNNYGGCYFRPDCHGTPAKSLAEAFEQQQQQKQEERGESMSTTPNGSGGSLMERLRAKQKQGAAAPATPPAAAAPETTKKINIVLEGGGVPTGAAAAPAAATAAPAGAATSRLRARLAGGAPVQAAAPVVSTGVGTVAPAASVVSSVPNVLPPDAPSRETPVSDVPPAAGEAAAAAPEPRKPGRPRKAAATAPAAPAAATATTAAAPAAPAAPAAQPATYASAVCPLEELYVDCLPVKGSGGYVMAEEILALAGADAAKSENVHDWRMISYTARGVLASALRARLAEIPKVLVVTSSLSGADVLIETLTPIARKVVRALRG